MVAAEDLAVDGGTGDAVHEAGAGNEVVDAPAGILLAGLETVAPP